MNRSRFLRDAAEFDAQQMAEYDAKISEGRSVRIPGLAAIDYRDSGC